MHIFCVRDDWEKKYNQMRIPPDAFEYRHSRKIVILMSFLSAEGMEKFCMFVSESALYLFWLISGMSDRVETFQ